MPPLESYAWPALLLLVKATCILVVALAASLLLRRASAGARHLVWLTALAGLLALPVLTAWGPLHVHVLPRSVAAGASAADAAAPDALRAASTRIEASLRD